MSLHKSGILIITDLLVASLELANHGWYCNNERLKKQLLLPKLVNWETTFKAPKGKIN